MVYLIKINVALILLYGFYKLIFANDTLLHMEAGYSHQYLHLGDACSQS